MKNQCPARVCWRRDICRTAAMSREHLLAYMRFHRITRVCLWSLGRSFTCQVPSHQRRLHNESKGFLMIEANCEHESKPIQTKLQLCEASITQNWRLEANNKAACRRLVKDRSDCPGPTYETDYTVPQGPSLKINLSHRCRGIYLLEAVFIEQA